MPVHRSWSDRDSSSEWTGSEEKSIQAHSDHLERELSYPGGLDTRKVSLSGSLKLVYHGMVGGGAVVGKSGLSEGQQSANGKPPRWQEGRVHQFRFTVEFDGPEPEQAGSQSLGASVCPPQL